MIDNCRLVHMYLCYLFATNSAVTGSNLASIIYSRKPTICIWTFQRALIGKIAGRKFLSIAKQLRNTKRKRVMLKTKFIPQIIDDSWRKIYSQLGQTQIRTNGLLELWIIRVVHLKVVKSFTRVSAL